MATKLEATKSQRVHREIGGRFIVTLTPEGLVMREKGRRKAFGPYPYGKLYQLLVERTVAAARAAKVTARKARRGLLRSR